MSTTGVPLLTFLMVVITPLLGGVVLIVFSRRRGPGHPACGKCGYNVRASIETGARCPECGADFAEVGIVPPVANRRRNPIMVASGVVLIVLALGCFGSSVMVQRARAAEMRAARAAAQAQAAAAAQNAAAAEGQTGAADDAAGE